MSVVFLITVVGEDKQGMLNQLAEVIQTHKGKWLSSEMIQLDGRFSAILKIDAPLTNVDALKASLTALPELEVSIHGQPGATSARPKQVQIHVDALDEVELMNDIRQLLLSHNIDIGKVKYNRINVPRTGTNVMTAELDLSIPSALDTDTIVKELNSLQEEMSVAVIPPYSGKNEGWMRALN